MGLSVPFATAAQNAAGTVQGAAVDPLGMREAFNASGAAPVYACRAWINFNGLGVVAIRGSGNVSSITDIGVGDYTVNFATALADVNFSAAVTSYETTGSYSCGPGVKARAVGSVNVLSFKSYTNVANDPDEVSVVVFR